MRPTVLVRDDESDVSTRFRDVLGEDGYEVFVANREVEFRRLVDEREIDLLILDLNLKDANGLALIREVRRSSDIGIVVVTDRDHETDQVVALEIGADDYIVKPFREREFRARINAVYRRARGQRFSGQTGEGNDSRPSTTQTQPDEITFDGYVMNLPMRRLFGPDERETDLTASEFDLLHALVASRGMVLTREKIMSELRGEEWECYDRAVDSIISRLRKKIPAPDGQNHYIRTVYGIGYSFRG